MTSDKHTEMTSQQGDLNVPSEVDESTVSVQPGDTDGQGIEAIRDELDDLLGEDATSDEEPGSKGKRWFLSKKWIAIAGTSLGIVLAVFLFYGRADSAVTETEKSDEAVDAMEVFQAMLADVAENKLVSLNIREFEVTDEMCEQLRELHSLEHVTIDRGQITDVGLAAIASLPNLHHIRLRLSPISDDGLATLAKCENLWMINLPHSKITSEGVNVLQELPRLRQLRIGTDQAGNEICRTIAKLESLRSVHLIGIGVTDEGMKLLADMPHLESLYLDDSAVTDIGWQWLFDSRPQLHVHVDQNHHDRDPKGHRH